MKNMTLIIVFDRDFKNVLVCRREKDPWRGKYNFVGGKIEPGEEPLNSASRKLFEETRILETERTPLREVMDFVYHWDTKEPERLFVYSTMMHGLPESITLHNEMNPLIWLDLEDSDLSNASHLRVMEP